MKIGIFSEIIEDKFFLIDLIKSRVFGSHANLLLLEEWNRSTSVDSVSERLNENYFLCSYFRVQFKIQKAAKNCHKG